MESVSTRDALRGTSLCFPHKYILNSRRGWSVLGETSFQAWAQAPARIGLEGRPPTLNTLNLPIHTLT